MKGFKNSWIVTEKGLEKTLEKEWDLFSVLEADDSESATVEKEEQKPEIQPMRSEEKIGVESKNVSYDGEDEEEETFDDEEVGEQPFAINTKGKKEEEKVGYVHGHGWNPGNAMKNPADTIVIKTEDGKSHPTPKRFVLEVITKAANVA